MLKIGLLLACAGTLQVVLLLLTFNAVVWFSIPRSGVDFGPIDIISFFCLPLTAQIFYRSLRDANVLVVNATAIVGAGGRPLNIALKTWRTVFILAFGSIAGFVSVIGLKVFEQFVWAEIISIFNMTLKIIIGVLVIISSIFFDPPSLSALFYAFHKWWVEIFGAIQIYEDTLLVGIHRDDSGDEDLSQHGDDDDYNNDNEVTEM